MYFKLFIVVAVILINTQVCTSKDLNLGSTLKAKLYTNNTVQLPAIAGVVRSQIVEYSPKQKIKAIRVTDLNKSSETPTITSGGVAFEFVNIKLKSDRGKSLKYKVEIYI